MDVVGQVNGIISEIAGIPPLTLKPLEKTAQAINNDPHFDAATSILINSKLPSSSTTNYYTKPEDQHMFPKLIDNFPSYLDTLDA